jgi:hypothetical protein
MRAGTMAQLSLFGFSSSSKKVASSHSREMAPLLICAAAVKPIKHETGVFSASAGKVLHLNSSLGGPSVLGIVLRDGVGDLTRGFVREKSGG